MLNLINRFRKYFFGYGVPKPGNYSLDKYQWDISAQKWWVACSPKEAADGWRDLDKKLTNILRKENSESHIQKD